MSLRDFIKATAKEFQDANKAKTAKVASIEQERMTGG